MERNGTATERAVAAHYAQGSLEQALFAALRESGADPDRLTASAIGGADEFHLGGHDATRAFGEDAGFAPGARLIDIGSGLGGPARYFAETLRADVTGIDLTADFVRLANELTRRCGLSTRARFVEGSALSLPFGDAAFGGGYLIHVAMNIADKAKLFAEVRRVLRPGATFALYDPMRGNGEPIAYPMPYPLPWAESEATSFVETQDVYRRFLEGAGFAVQSITNRRELVIAVNRAARERAEREGPPKLSIHGLLGPDRRQRFVNVGRAVESSIVAPVQIIARAV